MRGNVYRHGRRRTGSFRLAVVAGAAVALAIVLGSASSAMAKTGNLARFHAPAAVHSSPPPVVVLKVPPPIAHAAGHKIA
jgi:hypothetical protein